MNNNIKPVKPITYDEEDAYIVHFGRYGIDVIVTGTTYHVVIPHTDDGNFHASIDYHLACDRLNEDAAARDEVMRVGLTAILSKAILDE